jgi:hypothetical protein
MGMMVRTIVMMALNRAAKLQHEAVAAATRRRSSASKRVLTESVMMRLPAAVEA